MARVEDENGKISLREMRASACFKIDGSIEQWVMEDGEVGNKEKPCRCDMHFRTCSPHARVPRCSTDYMGKGGIRTGDAKNIYTWTDQKVLIYITPAIVLSSKKKMCEFFWNFLENIIVHKNL